MSSSSTAATVPAPLIPVHTTGELGGLGNMIRKELSQWLGTRLWWMQTLIWVVMLNGITTLIMLDSSMDPAALLEQAVSAFLQVAALATSIGVVLTIQGAVVGEKELGTAAWVMSKPVSRSSFVVAKLIANSIGFLVTAVLIPSIVFAVETRFLLSTTLDLGRFALATSVLGLSIVFYVTLTIALGTLFKGRGPVAGIGIGLILVGQFFKGMIPLSFVLITPWLLGDASTSLALGSIPEWNRMIPLAATGAATLALAFLGMWRFKREEF